MGGSLEDQGSPLQSHHVFPAQALQKDEERSVQVAAEEESVCKLLVYGVATFDPGLVWQKLQFPKRFQGLGFRVWGLGFGAWGLGFRV